VYVTARQYGSLDPRQPDGSGGYGEALDRLFRVGLQVVDECVVNQILRPLARAISMK